MKFIKTYKSFLSESECKSIIEKYSNENLEIGNVGENITNIDKLKKIRDAKIIRVELPELQNRLETLLCNEIQLEGYKLDSINKFQFIKYEIGGHYDWHTDSGNDGIYANRFYTIVIQLNNEYIGGNLLYKDENSTEVVFEKGIGNLFIFNSNLLHKVTNVTDGDRFTLVSWVNVKKINSLI